MNESPAGRTSREKITRLYGYTVYSYLFPGLPFVLHLIDAYTFALTGTFFLSVAFLSLLPAGSTGLFFTVKGLSLASKNNDYQKKDTGYANLIMGIIIVCAGLLAAALAYVMAS